MHISLSRRRSTAGFTFIELLVSLTLLAGVSLYLFQAFISGMMHAGRANEQVAATTLGSQVMEQIRASANPYTMVGFVDMPRSALPLPAPYTGVVNPTPHTFQIAVDVTPDNNLTLITATVRVYRPADPDASPFVALTSVLDDQ